MIVFRVVLIALDLVSMTFSPWCVLCWQWRSGSRSMCFFVFLISSVEGLKIVLLNKIYYTFTLYIIASRSILYMYSLSINNYNNNYINISIIIIIIISQKRVQKYIFIYDLYIHVRDRVIYFYYLLRVECFSNKNKCVCATCCSVQIHTDKCATTPRI